MQRSGRAEACVNLPVDLWELDVLTDASGNPTTIVGKGGWGKPSVAVLDLKGNVTDVRNAVKDSLPAGRVFPTTFTDREDDLELRVAFDFDGVVAGDSSEPVYKKKGLKAFQRSETDHAMELATRRPSRAFPQRDQPPAAV
jgi:hypothetical protein